MELHSSDLVAPEFRDLATAYLEGRVNPIEAAIALGGFRDVFESVSPGVFDTFSMISSERDAIAVGEHRDLWHPSVRAVEGAKHDRAQQWAGPMMHEACKLSVSALPTCGETAT